jgi:chemotaxis protein CheZ
MSSDTPENNALSGPVPEELVQRIGRLTCMLRDSMQELGLDKAVENAAQAIPDTRERLSYVAAMTEQAAERALNAIDQAQPIQESLTRGAQVLEQDWTQWSNQSPEASPSPALIQQTRAFLAEVPQQTRATQNQLMEILMAQDFQDLTGQVIKKLMKVIEEIEQQLVQVLVDCVPGGSEKMILRCLNAAGAATGSSLHGPQIKPEADAVDGQEQVDDLLAQLGF